MSRGVIKTIGMEKVKMEIYYLQVRITISSTEGMRPKLKKVGCTYLIRYEEINFFKNIISL